MNIHVSYNVENYAIILLSICSPKAEGPKPGLHMYLVDVDQLLASLLVIAMAVSQSFTKLQYPGFHPEKKLWGEKWAW